MLIAPTIVTTGLSHACPCEEIHNKDGQLLTHLAYLLETCSLTLSLKMEKKPQKQTQINKLMNE